MTLARWAIVAAGAALGAWVLILGCDQASDVSPAPFDFVQLAENYNWAKAKRNLATIGRALQMYRETQDLKPPSRWESATDAGLPPGGLYDLARFYNLTNDVLFTERIVQQPKIGKATVGSGYQYVIGAAPELLSTAEHKALWSKRNMKLPIVMDNGMYSMTVMGEARDEKKGVRVLVLRLDGKVYETMFVPFNYKDLLLKQ